MAPLEKVEVRLWECGGFMLPCSIWIHEVQEVKGLEVRVASLMEQRMGPVEQERMGRPLEVGLGPAL